MIQTPGFRGILKRDFPLAPLTSWRIGGPAEVFLIPADMDDLLYVLEIARLQGLPLFVLGRGSNLLIDDQGIPGITLQLGKSFQDISQKGNKLHVGADYPMPRLAQHVRKLGFAGYEWLAGIPGTVGAGVVINAGKGTEGGVDMQSVLHSVRYLDVDGQIVVEDLDNLGLSYRCSRLKGQPVIVTEAIFRLTQPDDPEAIKHRIRKILTERRKKFPLNLPNAGSVFKRPEGYLPAGKLIDEAGLKGLRIGDAQISALHANFIVNLGQATAQEIKALMCLVVEKVFKVHGVYLEKEVIFFPEDEIWQK